MSWVSTLISTGPWPLQAAFWVIAVTLLWLVTSIPAYLVLPSLRRAHAAVSALAQRLWASIATRIGTADSAMDEELSTFAEQQRLVIVRQAHLSAFQASAAKVLEPVQRITADLTSALSEARAVEVALPAPADGGTRASDVPSPSISSVDANDFASVRIAGFLLPVFLGMLLALIAVNTGMLGQILKDLGLVPPTIMLFGVPLARLFAAFLTGIEASTGLLYGWRGVRTEPIPGMPRRIDGMRWFALAAAVAFGVVEGFFYSRIAGSTESVSFAWITLSQQGIFFGWGVVLVLLLFGLGDACFEAFVAVVKGHSVSAFRRALTRAEKRARRLHSDSSKLGILAESTRRNLQDIRELLSARGDMHPLVAAIENLQHDLRRLREETPDWTSPQAAVAARAEARSLRNRIGVWLIVAVFAIAAFVLAVFMALSWVSPRWSVELRIAVAAGIAAVLCAAGFLMDNKTSFFVDRAGSLTQVSPMTSGRMATAVTMAVVAIVMVATPLSAVRPTLNSLGTWMFAMIGGAAVVLACRELGGALSITLLLVRRGLQAVGFMTLRIFCFISTVLSWLVGCLAWLIRLVAEPMVRFRGEPDALA
jgi:hypothetical protein